MAAPVVPDVRTYGDFAGLDALKHSARAQDPQAIRQVARQFESLFARMMLKSMRDAIGRDPIFGSDQSQMYQGMFDDQLSMELTRGRGLGLADMLVRQLQRLGVGSAAAAPAGTANGTQPSGTQTGAPERSAPQRSGATAPAAAVPAATRASFVRELWPQAQAAAQALGVDPRAVVAQAALETRWGQRIPATAAGSSSHNLFGIKASGAWNGPTAAASTLEYQQGSAGVEDAQFRAYPSRSQSVQDYVALLSTPRYAAARNTGGDIAAFATELQQAGYATDPDYARKLTAIAQALPVSASASAVSAAAAPASDTLLKLADVLPISGQTRSL